MMENAKKQPVLILLVQNYQLNKEVPISKFSRRGRVAARRQNFFMSTYPCGRVAAWLQPLIKPLTHIVGSLLYVTPNNPQKPQNNLIGMWNILIFI